MQADSAANEPSRNDLVRWFDEGEPVQLVGSEIPMFCSACGKPHPGFAKTASWARSYVCSCGSSKFQGTATFYG